MHLRATLKELLEQVELVLTSTPNDTYRAKLSVLNGSSIGQHVRHILEFFVCLEQGYFNGTVNYDKRRRDHYLESERGVALECIRTIIEQTRHHRLMKTLQLEFSYDRNDLEILTVETNYQRELVYNIEHAVHHMAMIRIGLREAMPQLCLPENFGVAASTVRHKELVAH